MSFLLILSQLLGLVAFGALIWLVVRAAHEHVLWAVAVLLLSPIGAVVFAVRHWEAAKRPFQLYIASFVVGLALSVHLFMSWGGGEVLRTSGIVNSGIHDQTLTQQDALAFMRANLDFIENSGVSEEERAKLETMREFLSSAESGMDEDEQRRLAIKMIEEVDPSTLDEEGRRELERLRQTYSAPAAISAAPPLAVDEEADADPVPRARRAMPEVTVYWEYVVIDPGEAAAYVGDEVKVLRRNGTERAGTLIGASQDSLRVERRIHGGTVEFEVSRGDVHSFLVRKRVSASS
jgi:hypothetical protein